MTTLNCTENRSYEGYEKCGEILKIFVKGEKRYGLFCSLCQEIYLHLESFIFHVEERHRQHTHIEYGMETDHDYSQYINGEDNVKSNDCIQKTFVDPLDEPEVLLVDQSNILYNSENYDFHMNDNKGELSIITNGILITEQIKSERKSKDFESELDEYLQYSQNSLTDITVKKNYEKQDGFNSFYERFLKIDENNKTCKNAEEINYRKNNVDLIVEKFMENDANVITLIAAYRKQDELWDTTNPEKYINHCWKKRQHALQKIVDDVKNEIGLVLNISDIECIIEYLRMQYIHEIHDRSLLSKVDDYKQIWFYEQLDFLRPTFISKTEKGQLLSKLELSDEKIIIFIDVYKTYSCLWDEENIYYNSEQYRQNTLIVMTKEINNRLQTNYNVIDIESKIDLIHKMVAREKECEINFHQTENKMNSEYKSSNKFSKNIEFLRAHIAPFKCPYCPKIISRICSYRKHIAKHDGSKPFKCSICHYEFSQKPGYVIHLRRHIQDFPFICNYCDKGFPCKKELKLHLQNHPEYKKDYMCDVCGEGFTQYKLLNWHLKVHNNTRDYICKICNKGFTNPKLLFQHRSVHSQEKNICKLCGKTYAHYRGLSRHVVKDHGTTAAAIATVCGEKPRKRVLSVYERKPAI